MKGLGLACSLEAGHPRVRGVLVEFRDGDAVASSVFNHLGNPQTEFAQQLVDLADALRSQLPDISPDAVVIRSIDWTPNRREEFVQKRYSVEGVLVETARRAVERTFALNGRLVAQRCGGSKEEVEARALALVTDDRLKDAAAAGLAALRLAEGG